MSDTTFSAEPGRQEIIITRSIDAPRERLFKAMTDPKLIPQWWGPRRYNTKVEKQEFKAGGIWRYINVDSDGKQYAFHGVFHLIAAPQRIIQTFEFEGAPGHVSLETMTLEARGSQTLVQAHSVFQSVADRDGMIQGNMEEGVRETYDRLEEIIAKLK